MYPQILEYSSFWQVELIFLPMYTLYLAMFLMSGMWQKWQCVT
jgi:hypothetical protein